MYISLQYRFTKQDAFIGYHDDTPPAVIFQATEQLHKKCCNINENSEEWKKTVLFDSKNILLQMASPEAVIRLNQTEISDEQQKLQNVYFSEQCHGSIVEFFHHQFKCYTTTGQCGLCIQVCETNIILTFYSFLDYYT